MSIFKDQAQFMEACGQTVGEFNKPQAQLYANLIGEEIDELATAAENNDPQEVLKELMDVIVVLVGYGHSLGFDMDGAWMEVWKSNMSKIDPVTGKVEKRDDGKVLKPATYVAPDMSKYVHSGENK